MSSGLRILITLLTVMSVAAAGVWINRIALLQHLLETRFDLNLKIETLNVSPGKTIRIHGTGLALEARNYRVNARDITVGIRPEAFRTGGYYIEYLKGSDGAIELLAQKSDATEPAVEQETGQPRWIPTAFSLNNIQFTYQDDDQDVRAQLDICNSTHLGNGNVQLVCQGQLQQSPIKVVGSYRLPDQQGKVEPLNVDVNWGQYKLIAHGTVDALSGFEGANLDMNLKAPSSAPLMELLGAKEVRAGTVDLSANITHQSAGYSIELAGRLSEIALSLSGQIDSFRNVNQAEVDYSLAGPSLYEAGALMNEFRLQPQPFSVTGHASLSGEHLTLKDTRVGVQQGVLEANIDMPAFPQTAGMEVDIRADQFRPNLLKPVAELCQLPYEPLDLDIQVVMIDQGQSLKASIDGASYDITIEGTLNETPGLNRVKVAVQGTSLNTIGHCLNVELPDVPAELTASVEQQENRVKVTDIDLSSDLAEIQGSIYVALDTPFSFAANLAFTVPDALTLFDEITDYESPLENFPLSGVVKLTGSTEHLAIENFDFNAAGHEGSITGALGSPDSLEGLQLTINMAGVNLRDLLVDAESSRDHAQPYQLTTQISNERDGWLINGLQLDLVNTRVNLDGRLTSLPLYLGSSLNLEAQGENIQNLFGPWVDHPLPETGFSISTRIEFTEDFFRFENLNITVGQHSLISDISVDRPPDYSNTFGHLTLQGPSTHELNTVLGIDADVLDRPYAFSFNLKGDLDRLVFSDLKSQIAETDIAGQIVFQNTTPYGIDIDLVSDSFYLPLIYPSLDDAENNPEENTTDDGRVFSDQPFPTDWLHLFEGEFTWDMKRVWSKEEYSAEILLDLALADGELTARNIHWDSDDSKGDLKFSLQHIDNGVGLTLDATSSRLPLVWLMAGESLPSRNTSFRALLESEGNSFRSLMSNLDGSIAWQGGGGRIQSNRLEFLFGDFLTSAASAIVGRQSAEDRATTKVSCTSGGVYFVDGTAHLAPGIVSRTNRTDFYASGNIKLGEEKLRLIFLTKSRKGIGVSPLKVVAPRLKVSGTMTEPRFSVDTASTALSTGAAVFSGGVTVLATGLWDRMSSSSDACMQLYQQALSLPEFSRHKVSQPSE